MGLVEDLQEELKKVPQPILQKIIGWGKEHNQRVEGDNHPFIYAIYFHPNPESGEGEFHLIVNPPYSKKLSDELINFELEILNKDNFDVHLKNWPCGYDGIAGYGFFKELCVFDYVKVKAPNP